MRKQTSIPTLPLLLALLAACDADSDPRGATVSRMDAVPFPGPMPITDTDGSGSGSGGSDTDDADGSGTGDMANCEPLDPEQHALALAEDYELPGSTDEVICDDGEVELADESLEEIGAWQPWGGCGYMKDITGYLPPPKIFGTECADYLGVKVTPDKDKGPDQRACAEIMAASDKCIDDARKQCDAYAAGKGGTAKFSVTYKYQNDCYYSKAKEKSYLNIIGVTCEGTIDRDADWTCDVTPAG
jgi:hypothetical protein